MKTSKLFFFLLCVTMVFACRNQSTSDVVIEVKPPQNTEAIDREDIVDADTVFDKVNRIIKEEMAKKKLQFNIVKQEGAATSDSLIVHEYVFPTGSYSEFLVNTRVYYSDSSAKEEMIDLKRAKKRMIKSGELVKIAFYYFRIDNKIYSFFSSADIDHIRQTIYDRIIKEMNMKEEDIEQL